MASQLTWTLEGDVIEIKATGNYTVDELLDIIEQALTSFSVPVKVAIIIDAKTVKAVRSEKDYLKIAERLISHEKEIRCLAYVTLSESQHDVISEAARYARFNQLGEVDSFRDIDSAKKWVDKNT